MFSQLLKLFPRVEFQALAKRTYAERHARGVHLLGTIRGDAVLPTPLDHEVIGWVTDALRQSHADEKWFHEEAIARLQAEYTRLQSRIDAMYIDKLNGRVDAAFFDRMAAEWRAEQDRILRAVEEHQAASRETGEDG